MHRGKQVGLGRQQHREKAAVGGADATHPGRIDVRMRLEKPGGALDDLPGGLELGDRHLGHPEVADLALVLQLLERSELVGQGDVRVDPVQLVEVDALHVEAAQGHLDALAQVVRAAHRRPSVRTGPGQPALRGDDHALVGVQRLTDQVLGDERPVGVSRVDEVHTQLDSPSQQRDGAVAVGRFTPDPGAGDPHGTVPEAVDRQVPADLEGA